VTLSQKCLANLSKHITEPMLNILSTDAHHATTEHVHETLLTTPIRNDALWLLMHATVDFHDKPMGCRKEINDEHPKRMLPPKLDALQSPVTQRTPKQSLTRSGILPHEASTRYKGEKRACVGREHADPSDRSVPARSKESRAPRGVLARFFRAKAAPAPHTLA
jgi:hypothetical protein